MESRRVSRAGRPLRRVPYAARPGFNERGYDERSAAFLTGGINDHWFAPNLTGAAADGLGRWSADDIATFLRSGHAARGAVFGAMAPVVGESTALLTDADRHAIAVT